MSDIKIPRPLVLMILDGFGISFLQEGNAIYAAKMENFERWVREYPSAVIKASGIEVGLPWGESGNSEVGHKNMGSGRIIYQPLPQITMSIENKSFFKNPAFVAATNHVKERPNSALHLIGCVSDGGVHSHVDHLLAILQLAKKEGVSNRTFVHAFLDGRDTPAISAGSYLKKVQEAIDHTKSGGIASLVGRYFAMDRNNNWDRTKVAYDLLTDGIGEHTDSWKDALESAYEKKETDETVTAYVITKHGEPLRKIQDGDTVIFFNFRPDRARQLTYAFTTKGFNDFPVQNWTDLEFVTMSEYQKDLPVTVAFPEEQAEFPTGRVVSDAGKTQLRIAETEKYAHVTYYFNSGREISFPGEDRVMVPSPNVKNYSDTPEMSAKVIADHVVKEINKDKYDLIIMNFANPDMIGHTGEYDATVESLQFLDKEMKKIIDVTIAKDGAVLITADHGNAEEMLNPTTHQISKDHTANPVPVIYITANNKQDPPKEEEMVMQVLSTPIGCLADIGPTVLEIMQIPQPPQMTAMSILRSLV
ncbi:MAG: 2,3-bisphosphoglycerate-independent phosphoglycerate mutase [bacterium]|nr:2,3-bisphosphoglycerate-independent phosphoglycerate mutase [bacterium]